uniref:Uncharacterized protein n=1 Tax=Arion vulgaris TaxID=1028688 RepID=A0A0B6ZPL9_9EUPU
MKKIQSKFQDYTDHVFGQSTEYTYSPDSKDSAIFCPKNEDILKLNKKVLGK